MDFNNHNQLFKNRSEERMKAQRLLFLIALLLAGSAHGLSQTSPPERRAFREYTSPEELVSIAPTATMDKALTALSEVSKKFIGKIIIDTEHRAMPINVDIQGMQWRDALETICRKSNIWYTEYETYIQLTGMGGSEGSTAAATPGSPDIQKEVASFRSREIKISVVFFEVNLGQLEEVGVNWDFMKSTTDYAVDASFLAADRVSSNIFKAEVTPKVSFANLNFLAQFFSNYDLGEILSSPSINVRSGEDGRIQVGQDFSVKERDFAGNLIDKFYSAGTIIKVKPQVITEQGVNFVHMVIDVERSSVNPGTVSTIINKSKANTNVLLLDGEETIIGGLYSSEVNTLRTGIPFLKDLPWYVFGLRYLFGYDKDEVKKKELVILLKADLVPTLQERITQKVKADGVYERWHEEKEREAQHMRGGGDQ
ncbi:MAG: pilQ [Bacteroidetes bacterium]|nr:pilQ [Bacteroidota bacterium]